MVLQRGTTRRLLDRRRCDAHSLLVVGVAYGTGEADPLLAPGAAFDLQAGSGRDGMPTLAQLGKGEERVVTSTGACRVGGQVKLRVFDRNCWRRGWMGVDDAGWSAPGASGSSWSDSRGARQPGDGRGGCDCERATGGSNSGGCRSLFAENYFADLCGRRRLKQEAGGLGNSAAGRKDADEGFALALISTEVDSGGDRAVLGAAASVCEAVGKRYQGRPPRRPPRLGWSWISWNYCSPGRRPRSR